MIRIITGLVNGTAELSRCLTLCLWMAGFWVLRYVLHSISTTISHHATFHVLAKTRIRLMDKLATLPLGTVLERSSGSYKNIIVERVDAIETTLAHLLPEMTTNIVGALAVLALLFSVDWRMGLSMLIVVPLGGAALMSMFHDYEKNFQRAVASTKALNDTAVEYISGIEVIKAFGQSKTSYAKFVSAAKEGADCFIDWMRSNLFGQSAGMAIFPATLHGVSLNIQPGTVNALVGPSGSGKSTITRLIASLWDVKESVVRLGGVDIRTLPLSECTKRIAYVSQDNYLFDLSVMDNIRLGRQGASDEEVIAAAKACGCHAFIMSLENGYQTVCGAAGGHLSSGERQRISIARAIMKDAPIILLDEATANVDPENEKELMEAVDELTHDKTVILIAHRLKTVRNADRIFVVDHGRIVQQGTHDQLVAVDGLYSRFVVERRQAAGWKA